MEPWIVAAPQLHKISGTKRVETQDCPSDERETLETPIRAETAEEIAARAFAVGSLIAGKYRIERKLAAGGMGVVVEATHVALERPVAIKYLKSGAATPQLVVERFEREGRLAAQLTSEHVVRVHDVGTLEDGTPYMVMELLKGKDLARLLEESGALSVPRAVDYALQACAALAEAHAVRIVHRDIKPENLLLAERPADAPIVKIVDFGISKAPPRRDARGDWLRETSDTARFGTPAYMSPEQLRSSAHVDARTDIWALGVTLHELLTMQLPFSGDDMPQLCTNILSSPAVKVTAVRAGVPPVLEAIILKCLEKNPARRFQNVAELAQELAPLGPPDALGRVDRIRTILRISGARVVSTAPQGADDSNVIRRVVRPALPTNRPTGRAPWRLGTLVAAAGLAIGTASMSVALARNGAAVAPRELSAHGAIAIAVPETTTTQVTDAPPVAASPQSVVAPVSSPPPSGAEDAGGMGAAQEPTTAASAATRSATPKPPSRRPVTRALPSPDRRTLFGERK
jgi:serine/threonine protein kinase